jgi:hypothetical protein
MTIAYVGDFQQKVANLADGRYRTFLKIGRLASRFREVIQHALGGIICAPHGRSAHAVKPAHAALHRLLPDGCENVLRLPAAVAKVSDGVAHPLPCRPQSRKRRSRLQHLT